MSLRKLFLTSAFLGTSLIGVSHAQQTAAITTDHAYSDHRIALEQAVLNGLAYLKPQ